MKDFFISYTRVDEPWAVWVAWVLEEAGYSVVLEAWDFRPGSNFVLDMHRALEEAERILTILTPSYVESKYSKAEWAAGLAEDPMGVERKVIPVRVANCTPSGLLRSLSWIDLLGLDGEEPARKKLLDGLNTQRAKPTNPPPFPGTAPYRATRSHPAFPPRDTKRETAPTHFIPRLSTKATELDLRRFMQSSFEELRRYFEQGLEALKLSDERFDIEVQHLHSMKFVVEVYVDGKLQTGAKFLLGQLMGSHLQIGYSEGRLLGPDHDNQFNELLEAESDSQGIHLRTTMGAAYMGVGLEHLDFKRMTSAQASKYLWVCFIQKIGSDTSASSGSFPRLLPSPEAADAPRDIVYGERRTPEPTNTEQLVRWREYARKQIAPFFGLEFVEPYWQTGFVVFAERGLIFLLVTLEKDSMAETFQYADRFLSPTRFQWQSQNRTSQEGKHGQLLRTDLNERVSVHLFIREKKKTRAGMALPFVYCGRVQFESWKGEKPITVIWKLEEPVPAALRKMLKVPEAS